jgi:hypothetical protein
MRLLGQRFERMSCLRVLIALSATLVPKAGTLLVFKLRKG